MDPDLTYRDIRQDKKIENLYNIIRPLGISSHYVQQACISNLLVTVFAARRLENFLSTDTFLTLINCCNGRPTRKELTAGPHDQEANTAP
jgi:hypothetical protein